MSGSGRTYSNAKERLYRGELIGFLFALLATIVLLLTGSVNNGNGWIILVAGVVGFLLTWIAQPFRYPSSPLSDNSTPESHS